jgi:uncharacterized protein
MYARFGLALMLNHACNLSCRYCYTGKKFDKAMPEAVSSAALARAIQAIQTGGTLELSFVGGEPLLELDRLRCVLAEARRRCEEAGIQLQVTLTTNGTVSTPEALKIMLDPVVDLAISVDGTPEIHDRYRRFSPELGSSRTVLSTIQKLQAAGKVFRILSVVRPNTLDELPNALRFFQIINANVIELALDLSALWTDGDLVRLEASVAESVEVWREGLPGFVVNWFNQKTLEWTGVLLNSHGNCLFGDGQIAVAPSGNLYPCERLIGEDHPTNAMRLPGTALDHGPFERLTPPGLPAQPREMIACGLSCACSNVIRTGNPHTPDRLLRHLDRVCMEEVQRVLTPVQVDRVQEDVPPYKDESAVNITPAKRSGESQA